MFLYHSFSHPSSFQHTCPVRQHQRRNQTLDLTQFLRQESTVMLANIVIAWQVFQLAGLGHKQQRRCHICVNQFCPRP